MTRPPNRKKGRTLPMSAMNGGSNEGQIDDDIVWDENNPPTVHLCTLNDEEHATDCDGNCGERALSEIDVMLHNEHLAWARAGMMPLMVPVGFDAFGIPGMPIDLFDTEAKMHGVINALIKAGVLTEEEMDFEFKQAKFEKMNKVRTLNEQAVKSARAAAMLSIAQNKLLGPNGEVL